MNKFSKLLIILALLFAIFVTVAGCSPNNREPWTITNIEVLSHFTNDPPRGCEYTVRLSGAAFNDEFSFIDDCNCFQIGDTVKIAKP